MAEIILAEKTVDGFSYMSSYGAYVKLRDGETIPLKVGNTYTVIWDGTKYECVGQDTNDLDEGSVTVGNLASFDFAGNGEPFAVVGGPEGVVYMSFEEGESHTVAIYDGVLEEDSGGEGGYLFENVELSYDEGYGLWMQQLDGSIGLNDGTTYTVTLNGTDYVREAYSHTMDGQTNVVLGNSKSLGGEDTGEPFLMVCVPIDSDNSMVSVYWLDETPLESCTVSLYEGDITSGGGGTEDGYLLKDAELAFELEINSETRYVNNEAVVEISVGKTYTVIWDGSYYDCTAKEYTPTDDGNTWTFVTLGNLSIQNSADANTHEPFLYLYLSLEGNNGANFKTLETDASHVISIYDGVLEHPAVTYADIYTYDKDGRAVLHEKRSSVTFDTPDGRYAVFKLSHIADSRS